MLFGTSGIRGLYGSDITEELALRVANAFADADVAIGRDTRKTGQSLSEAATAGVLSRGRDVINLGIVPTPTLALATLKHSCNGIMITASHNPPEYNGLKLIAKGREISKTREKKIEAAFEKGIYQRNNAGSLIHDSTIIKDHKDMICSLVDYKAIEKRKPKIVIDCNGAGSAITPSLLSDLGCEVISLNSEIGPFNRPSEPNDENLTTLKALVPRMGADFGLAHDGDGDRTVAVDGQGTVLPLDVQLAIMSQTELRKSKNKKIVTTMEASLAVRETVEKEGGTITITPVGSTYVAEKLETENAIFGGEPCGEYIYEKGVHVPDGPLAAAKLVEMFVHQGRFSKLIKAFKTNPMAREKFKIDKKYEVVEAIKEEINIQGEVCEEDGIRIDEEDGWFLVRASGTEPIVRLTMEYKDRKKLDKRKDELSKLINKKIKENS